MNNKFEQASRLKLSYASTIGTLTTQDLWDLPLQSNRGASLDQVAINIHEKIEQIGKKSFVSKNTKDKVLELKMDIVKYIIETKLQEAEELKQANENKQQKDLLTNVIAEKEMDELKQTPLKELKKQVKKL